MSRMQTDIPAMAQFAIRKPTTRTIASGTTLDSERSGAEQADLLKIV